MARRPCAYSAVHRVGSVTIDLRVFGQPGDEPEAHEALGRLLASAQRQVAEVGFGGRAESIPEVIS